MLQKIGDKLQGQRWLAFVMLGMLALVFAAWGAYGIVDFTSTGGNYAAKVNGEEISLSQVKQAWQQQEPQYLRVFGGDIPAAQRDLLQSRILEGFIRNAAVYQQAEKLGFAVTDAQVQRAYQSEPAFQVDGKFSPQAARAALAAAGISPAAFDAEQRRNLAMNQVASTVALSEFLTPTELARLQALEDQQRELRFVLLTPQQFAGTAAIDTAAIEAWYGKHTADYQTTESVSLAFGELSLSDVAAAIKVSDAQLLERYEKNREAYVSAERRQARHILLTIDKPEAEAAVKAQADDLYKQLQAGKDFAELAKANSKDAGSASRGGDLGWADRSTYVPAFADALFALQAGQISTPVKTEFGYHIIKLEGIEATKSRSLDEVRGELLTQLAREQAAERFGEKQEKLQQRIERGVGNFDELITEFGLKPGTVPAFLKGSGGGSLGTDANLNQAVFSDRVIGQKAVGGPVSLGEDRLVVFRAIEHHPAQAKPLTDVRAAIVAELLRQRGSTAARAAADAAVLRLNAGESFDKVIADLKLKSEPARYVGRVDPGLPVQVLEAAFAGRAPSADKPLRKALSLDEGGAALLAITASRVADAAASDARLQAQRMSREQQRQGSLVTEAYLTALTNAAKVTKNSKAFE
jgi:peptidyl-prolyl cis-trans isomerase D